MENKSKFFTNEILSKLVNEINVAFWVWDTINDKLYYNAGFFDLVGQPFQEGAMEFSSWENMVHCDDREFACNELDLFYKGEIESYSVEIRIVKGNGEIIWVSDLGSITQIDEDGKITQIAGVMQDITEQKIHEKQMLEDEKKLSLAMKFAGFYIREWDIKNNTIKYDNNYLNSLGYFGEEWDNEVSKWMSLIHPDDMSFLEASIGKCLRKESKTYDYRVRVRKKNGEYIWVRDVGEVAKFDENGAPILFIGGRLDIDELEVAKIKLEHYQQDLETQIKQRSTDLKMRDKKLLELNRMSKKLIDIPMCENFPELVYDCLEEFSSIQQGARLAIFRPKIIDGVEICYLANKPKNKYLKDFSLEYIAETFKDTPISFVTKGMLNEDHREDFYQMVFKKSKDIDLSNIRFETEFPMIYESVTNNKILNAKSKDFPPEEFIFTKLQGIQSILMSPILINNAFWGFILLDEFTEKEFSEEDEKTLNLIGSVIAQSIEKNELELKANEAIKHNQLMLDATPMCCNLWENGKSIRTNNEAFKLFGVKNLEEFQENYKKLSPEYQPCGSKSSELVIEKTKIAAENGYSKFDWMHLDISGNEIPTETTLVKIPHSDKFLIAGYTRDLREYNNLVRENKLIEEDLDRAREEAELSSQAKSNFLANMSHEIRTPMNAISGMTDIILRESKSSEVNEYAQNIKRACDSLLSIINDVLDISKIESGKLDIIEGEYYLSQVITDVLTIATNRLENKSLLFTTTVQADIPDKLIGDDVRIKQIMVNILNNAIKFTQEGNIHFAVSGEFNGGLLELKFSVTDTGSGISEEDMDKLFVEFERVESKKNRTIEGTGLGLAISKKLCEMMNGEIKVSSKLGEGTTFTISLYQFYDKYEQIAKIEEQKSILIFETREIHSNSMKQACDELQLEKVVFCSLQSELNEALQENEFDYIFTTAMYLVKIQEMLLKLGTNSKIVLLADNMQIKAKYDYTSIIIPATAISIADVVNEKTHSNMGGETVNQFIAPDCCVLVVDDNVVNLKVAQGLMQPYKFKIETAENGLEAVNKIKSTKYDLVFMDHMMPVMDGVDATINIRKLEDDYFKTLPIIALTANAIIGTKQIFINEGMNDFLAKPIKLSCLNDILSKWLPKEKQIILDNNNTQFDDIQDVSVKNIFISGIDTDLGIKNVGGDFDTYVDILHMYYKDGLKRIPNIKIFHEQQQLLEYKIEVHALKSASASLGAMDISTKARLLEEASINQDLDFINNNTTTFIDDFNTLLDNIDNSLKDIIVEQDNTNTTPGEDSFYTESLTLLIEALDLIDINKCEELLNKLYSFSWDDTKFENINKINEFVESYEYDEAVGFIEGLM